MKKIVEKYKKIANQLFDEFLNEQFEKAHN
jgi:hypothetical protein